jgi:hypothetical protein
MKKEHIFFSLASEISVILLSIQQDIMAPQNKKRQPEVIIFCTNINAYRLRCVKKKKKKKKKTPLHGLSP